MSVAAAFDGDALVGLVGRDGHVSRLERPAFEQHHQFVEQVAPAEFGFVQLGVDIVVVEQELLAKEQLEESPDQEDEIRRIARMDRVEAALAQHPER